MATTNTNDSGSCLEKDENSCKLSFLLILAFRLNWASLGAYVVIFRYIARSCRSFVDMTLKEKRQSTMGQSTLLPQALWPHGLNVVAFLFDERHIGQRLLISAIACRCLYILCLAFDNGSADTVSSEKSFKT